MICRDATVDDVAAIAGLHAESWRRNYRGAYLDAYLDAAQAFYDARGGTAVGRTIAGLFPVGGTAAVLTYAWPDPSVLIDPR